MFIISDGLSTDGNPLPEIDILKDLGITIFSCYITNHDITNPRTLPNRPRLFDWDSGARLMFKMALYYEENASYANFFEKENWIVTKPNAKLFAQLNHTSLLDEFMEIVLLFSKTETPRGN